MPNLIDLVNVDRFNAQDCRDYLIALASQSAVDRPAVVRLTARVRARLASLQLENVWPVDVDTYPRRHVTVVDVRPGIWAPIADRYQPVNPSSPGDRQLADEMNGRPVDASPAGQTIGQLAPIDPRD
jgi:hypothetical protein